MQTHLADKEEHVGVGVEEGQEDARGGVDGLACKRRGERARVPHRDLAVAGLCATNRATDPRMSTKGRARLVRQQRGRCRTLEKPEVTTRSRSPSQTASDALTPT